MSLDLEFVRAQFPAFNEPSLRGTAFFENAGGSYACRHTIWRLNRFYKERKVQPYGAFPASVLGGLEMEDARDRLARMLGIQSDEISFGPSTTQNVYVLAQAFREWLEPGDEIIVTNQDHEANTGAWRKLADHGIIVREWQIDPATGELNVADLENMLNSRVRLVCFPHCSNVIGTINPVERICRIAKSAGAFTCVDGVSYAPHGLPNLRKLRADIYLFSAYKTFGPHQGIMAIGRDLAMALPNQGHDFNGGSLEKRFTPAGPDHAQVAACAGIADYFDALYRHHFKAGRDGTARAESAKCLIRDHEIELTRPVVDFLSDEPRARLLGTDVASDRAPTFALDTEKDPRDVAIHLAQLGIMAGAGDFYAVRPLRAMGIDPDRGVLRVSFVHYTSPADIDRLLEALSVTL